MPPVYDLKPMQGVQNWVMWSFLRIRVTSPAIEFCILWRCPIFVPGRPYRRALPSCSRNVTTSMCLAIVCGNTTNITTMLVSVVGYFIYVSPWSQMHQNTRPSLSRDRLHEQSSLQVDRLPLTDYSTRSYSVLSFLDSA